METKNNESNKVENSKQEIEKFKHKFLIIIIFSVILIMVLAVFVTFRYKNNTLKNSNLVDESSIVTNEVIEKLEDKKEETIKKFSNYDELRDFLENNVEDSSLPNYYDEEDILMEDELLAVPTADNSNKASNSMIMTSDDGSNNDDYSRTNIQVEGVDEADIIKTDGDYIYAVSKKNLFIIDSHDPKNLEILRIIEFDNQPKDIYLNGDRLVVFGYNSNIQKTKSYSIFPRYSQYTFFKIFDISDRKNPKQLKDYDFEGDYVNSRMIGDYVYFLTNTYNATYIDKMPVPRVLSDGEDIYNFSNRKCLNGKCPDVYYVDDFSGNYTMVNVMAININDVDDKNFNHEVFLLPYNQNLYVSQNNLYLTYTKYFDQNEFLVNLSLEVIQDKLTDWEKNKISKIKSTENYILNKQEKLAKIKVIINRKSFTAEEKDEFKDKIKDKVKDLYPQISDKFEQTVIHKIEINKGNLDYKGFGIVPGTVLNQFSMDENGGYFRIATTKNPSNFNLIIDDPMMSDDDLEEVSLGGIVSMPTKSTVNQSYNNLYVLDEDLKIKGKVENLAEGEKIYSVRFMGDRAYMVTFKQMDPLFVLDLKNPSEPKVLGNLKIPGFSNYLHPYDENHLIGIGRDTKQNDSGGYQAKGIKVALFDVSNVENPQEVSKYIFQDQSNSQALNDHKAVLFDKEKNLLVIPIDFYSQNNFNGVAVFKVTDKDIEMRGKISHQSSECINYNNNCDENVYNYNSNILRSLWIKDALYTFSNSFIQTNNISNLDLIKKLELRKKETKDDFRLLD